MCSPHASLTCVCQGGTSTMHGYMGHESHADLMGAVVFCLHVEVLGDGIVQLLLQLVNVVLCMEGRTMTRPGKSTSRRLKPNDAALQATHRTRSTQGPYPHLFSYKTTGCSPVGVAGPFRRYWRRPIGSQLQGTVPSIVRKCACIPPQISVCVLV